MLKIDCNVVAVEATSKPGKKRVRCVGSTSRADYGLGNASLSFTIDSRESEQWLIGRPINLEI